MHNASCIRVHIRFKTTASGGRSTPVNLASSSYRPHFIVKAGQPLGIVFVDAIDPVAHPGDARVATVALMYEGVDYAALAPGVRFDVVEGGKVVATRTMLVSP